MFVCVCHALSDKDIKTAEANGASSDQQIFDHFGVQVQCGTCVDSITGILKCSRRAQEGTGSLEEHEIPQERIG